MRSFNTKQVVLIVWVLLTIILPCPISAAREQPQFYHLTVIHTNDFHDYAPYALARKATIINQIRAEAPNVLLVDAGDLYVRGPYHKIFYGEMEMAALNAMHYDAWELGNNEFKGHPDPLIADQKLYNLINQAQFPTLCSSIKTAAGEYLPGVKPYTVKSVHGLNIGILGVSSMKVKNYPQASNKIVEDPVATAQQLLPNVKRESDIQIILSHAGLSADVQMDMKLAGSGVALIVGADDHYVISQPIYRTGGIPIVQAGGEDNIYLGRVDLTFENKDGKWVLVSHQGRLYPITNDIPMDPTIKEIIDRYLATTQKQAA
ncbi:cyclic-nucleotide 2'-phosphodiesterase (5'-nucleotidase family) [Sporomusaceae bacterium BoRhaA]|uniref:bifunctional metallophosphatase/5'-nucleotidase n=1 Tax=Pelorhabdus rhamnosifermentans TaxID=2772457 RepID=UPI001C062464|nr:metallophosphoesterase [Pelorhabdus rhamnosifermentans]MBU2700562.1 cyclic-nucleotide 2'-phosphodiesterase (5'-nucleotidase family) [Pelorhabdus rhamnosifermentans]